MKVGPTHDPMLEWDLYGQGYRARCVCGWKGPWTSDADEAHAMAVAHPEEPPMPDQQRNVVTAADAAHFVTVRWCTQCLVTPPSRHCVRHNVITAKIVPADSWRLRSDFTVEATNV